MNNRFFMNGDEWGLINIIPAENRQQYINTIKEKKEWLQNKSPDRYESWNIPIVIPPPEIPISARKIPLSDLGSFLAKFMPGAEGVDSCEDFTGEPFPCPECFAYALSTDDYWHCQGIYGYANNSIVELLHSTHLIAPSTVADELSDRITEFGLKYDLILVEYLSGIVDLSERDQVRRWIAPESEPSDNSS